MATASELRQLLKEDAAGKNLYDHLTETLMRIVLDRPANSYDAFELISADIKMNPLNPDPEKGKPVPPSEDELKGQLSYLTNATALTKLPEAPAENQGCRYPDLMDEAAVLEWAGVSLGKTEVYRLYLSIKTLADTLPGEADRTRFFGKIYTRGEPYYIVEVASLFEGEEIDPFKQEGKEGANKYTYMVTQTPEAAGGWTKLPEVTSAQVVACRQFKRLLTGNLEAAVPTFPVFPGNEANLLRTLVAIIGGATLISPDGFFEIEEDVGVKLAEAEALNERFPKAGEEMKDPEQWKHHEVELNALGRVKALPEQLDDNGDPIEPENPVEPNPDLNSINPESWSIRVGPAGAGLASSSCAVAKSILWPGAVAVCQGRRFLNVYVGNGVMYSPAAYNPPLPQRTQSEWKPAEEEAPLEEEADIRADPTPPVPEGEGEEE